MAFAPLPPARHRQKPEVLAPSCRLHGRWSCHAPPAGPERRRCQTSLGSKNVGWGGGSSSMGASCVGAGTCFEISPLHPPNSQLPGNTLFNEVGEHWVCLLRKGKLFGEVGLSPLNPPKKRKNVGCFPLNPLQSAKGTRHLEGPPSTPPPKGSRRFSRSRLHRLLRYIEEEHKLHPDLIHRKA